MPEVRLPFCKFSPGGNTTILVIEESLFAPPHTAISRSALASTIMQPDMLGGEQVGFIALKRVVPHLEMMGGEFCVNALRCAAVLWARLGLLGEKKQELGYYEHCVTCSGLDKAMLVQVKDSDSGEFEAAVGLLYPSPKGETAIQSCGPGQTVIRLAGITHLLIDASLHGLPTSPMENAAELRHTFSLESERACGVVWYHLPQNSGQMPDILPVVRVAATGSEIIETACGSASLALVLLAREQRKIRTLRILQPSGECLCVTLPLTKPQNYAQSYTWIGGPVRLLAEGFAYVKLEEAFLKQP